jgi:hypothetical protein
MINFNPHGIEFQDRIDSAIRLVDETHPSLPPHGTSIPGPISREAKGLVFVLLFGAYENLMHSLTRSLLEEALKMHVGNRRLRPGFRAFALVSSAKSIKDLSDKRLYSHGLPKLVNAADPGGRVCTIDPNSFPVDGSFMKSSQIIVWCNLFDISDPHLILHRTWTLIDAVVAQRNAIAHGRLTPDQVGRDYSEIEIRRLINDWRDDWVDFLNIVEAKAKSRDFYRTP